MLKNTCKDAKIKIMENTALQELDITASFCKISNWFLTSHKG